MRTVTISAADLSAMLGAAAQMAGQLEMLAGGFRSEKGAREAAAQTLKWWNHAKTKLPANLQYCRACFCVEERACAGLFGMVLMGACWWAEKPTKRRPGLCSRCAPSPKKKTQRSR